MDLTYDDFLRRAQDSGLLSEFSKWDLETARANPSFGYSALTLKKDWHGATTDEGRLLANQALNELRKSFAGYSGGPDGSGFISEGKIPGQIDTVLDKIGSFAIPEDPTAAARQAKLDEILNRGEFSWSKDTDPLWPVYKKQYLREGERATANALGQAAAATGGRPSSFAVGAATQAGDYYATKLNDIIPTLYQEAFNKYIQEYNLDLQDLQALNEQRSLWRQDWQDQLGLLDGQLSALQGQDAIDYGRFMDGINLGIQKDERDYQRSETERLTAADQVAAILRAGGVPSPELAAAAGLSEEYVQGVNAGWNRDNAVKQVADILAAGGVPSPELAAAAGLSEEYVQGVHGKFQREEADEQQTIARAQVDAILQAGGAPSPELIAASGYSNEYVTAMADAFKRQQAETAAKTAAKTTTTKVQNTTQSPVGGAMDYDGLFKAAKASGHPKSFLSQKSNYQKYGFSSSSGLWDDYQTWEEDMEDVGIPGDNGQPRGVGPTMRFDDYDSAVGYLRKKGVLGKRTPMRQSEWSTRKSSYKRTGHGSVEVKNYETYADYISAYVKYCMENPEK